MHVKRLTAKVGAVLSEHHQLTPTAAECSAPAQALMIQVEGGHSPIPEKDKRSFAAWSALVYRPEPRQAVDQHHRQIMEKTCVSSALDDNLQPMKAYLITAARQPGMSHAPQVTALADGAKNCWSGLSALTPECETLECILDWCHIAQKLQNVQNAFGEAFTTSLASAKGQRWHGHPPDARTKLAVLRDNLTDEGHRSQLTGLYEYRDWTQAYLVPYDARDQANKTYTSQVAASHIEALLNARHKRTKKMPWTRAGAQHVLQISALMAREEWESKGQDAVLLALGAAA
jgi:hypothetical protein